MQLQDLLTSAAERFPDKTALISSTEKITFGALHEHSNRVACRLRALGIGERDRVAILHENSVAAVVFFWGILKSGAQAVDIPCLAAAGTTSEIIRECNAVALVASDRQLQKLGGASAPDVVCTSGKPVNTSRWVHSLHDILATESATPPPAVGRGWDVALAIYTSGTTGKPKGVMLSHRNLLSNIRATNTLMRLTSSHSILMVVPLHFIHGRMQLLTHALIGGTIAFSDGFQFPQQVVAELARYQVTGFSGVPYHFSTLLQRTSLAQTDLPHLKYVVVTGGALSPHALRQLSLALPKVEIHIGYGQTETSPRISNLPPSELLSRPGCCGLPLPGVKVEIVGEDGATVKTGDLGEVVVSGPNVMCGYISADEITSQKIDALGRLHTGDLGRLDSDGYLYLVGRQSELIKCAGERVFPREIEAVLDVHPAIRESAVFGIPDEVLGEKIVACVVTDPLASVSTEEIRTHCLKSLPLVRVPREIRFSSELPKTSSGKIDRRTLRDAQTAFIPGDAAARSQSADAN